MNVARLSLSLIAGCAAALIAFSSFYVRGDLGGVMRFLRERGATRRLEASGASAQEVAQAKAQLLALAQGFADPDLAGRMIPLCLLLGVVVAVGVWGLFGRRLMRAQTGERPDVQERMVRRLAYRMGGAFTLSDLAARSPLSTEQAREVTGRMLERGQLKREGEGYRLS